MNIFKALSIEVDVNDIDLPVDYQKVNIGEVMTKYDFSIVEKSNEEKLLMVAKELANLNDKILIGFACFNFNEVVEINNHLNKINLSLNTVYIPSDKRIEDRKQKAIEEQRRWGYRDGISDEEIERNFVNFKATLEEIKDGLKNTSIDVKEV